MIGKLLNYFEWTGIAALVCCAIAAGLWLVFFRFGRRQLIAYLVALVLALAAIPLAALNSDVVSAYRSDTSHYYRQAAAGAEGAEGEPQQSPEDSAPEQPAYRQGGPVQRDPDATEADDEMAFLDRAAQEDDDVRVMSEAEVQEANRLDRWALLTVRVAAWLGAVLVVLAYFGIYHRTFQTLAPLPLSCRLLDRVVPRKRLARGRGLSTAQIRTHLETLIRKGETFVYFGREDPWPDRTALGRLPLKLAGLPKVHLTDASLLDGELVFESAWFDRCCFVVTDEAAGRRLLDEVMDLLRWRRVPKATVGRAVTLVWDVPWDLDRDTLDELAWHCRQANFCLLYCRDGDLPAEVEGLFEETVGATGGRADG